MKYYDVETKQFCENQNTDNTRVPFPDGMIKDYFDRTANGERFDIDKIDIPASFDREVIRKNLLYIELKYLLKNKGSEERINEIKEILYPADDEEIEQEQKPKQK